MTKENEHLEDLNDQMIVRREKMNELREKGIDPFGKPFKDTQFSIDLIEAYNHLSKEELKEQAIPAKVSGRLMAKRGSGKASFANLKDNKGNVQIYVRLDAVGEEQYEIFKTADLGDFIGITDRKSVV